MIYFWNDLQIAFAKLHAELKPGGLLTFYMNHRDNLNKVKFTYDDIFNKYTIEQVVEQLHESGFKDVSYTLKEGYIVSCRKG